MMNKDYKAKLLEKAGIYIDCCQLLKCVYKLLFSMPKKDRVIIGDKILEYNLSMIAHFSKVKNIEQNRRMTEFVNKALCKFGKILSWNIVNESFSLRV